VLNTDIADADLRAAIFRQVLSEDELVAAVDDAERITRPLDDNYLALVRIFKVCQSHIAMARDSR
jgi:hypothetical protein